MLTLGQMMKSRTIWTIILLFVVNGLHGVHDSIPVGFIPYIDALLALAAIYFRIVPKQIL